MEDAKRHAMLANLGGPHSPEDMANARSFITKNESRDLTEAQVDRAAREVLRMNRTAWVAWLTLGSYEDWADRVGVLTLPNAHRRRRQGWAARTPPANASTCLRTISQCALRHRRKKARTSSPWSSPPSSPGSDPRLPREPSGRRRNPVPGYQAFIDSDRVAPNTRAVLEARADVPEPPAILSAQQQSTLRAALARILPRRADPIDLAAPILTRLAKGKGDGWRFDSLPA